MIAASTFTELTVTGLGSDDFWEIVGGSFEGEVTVVNLVPLPILTTDGFVESFDIFEVATFVGEVLFPNFAFSSATLEVGVPFCFSNRAFKSATLLFSVIPPSSVALCVVYIVVSIILKWKFRTHLIIQLLCTLLLFLAAK